MDESQKNVHDHVREIVLVRHGETHRNRMKKRGRFAINEGELTDLCRMPDHLLLLTPLGEIQAKCIGKALALVRPDIKGFDAFFDSGFERAVKTMDFILSEQGLNPGRDERRRFHPEIREREMGFTYNMTADEVDRYFPWYAQYAMEFGRFYERAPGGENIPDVCLRVHTFLNSLRRAHSDERILVVTHGRVVLAFKYWLEKRDIREAEALFDEREIANCDVLIYARAQTGGRWKFLRDEAVERKIQSEYLRLVESHDDECRQAGLVAT